MGSTRSWNGYLSEKLGVTKERPISEMVINVLIISKIFIKIMFASFGDMYGHTKNDSNNIE